MKIYQHMLLATDLSEHSDRLARYARKMADEFDAKLSVIYVMEYSPVAYGGEYSIPIDVSLETSLEKKAKDCLAKLGRKFNIKTADQHLGHGSVKLAITDLAQEQNVDLIIVGAHSHTGLDALLGSRASAILNHSKCNVLVVRANTN